MFPKSSIVANLLFTRPGEFSRVSLLTKHMNITMPLSKEMEELLVSQIMEVLCNGGWLQD